jgi:hypothetical protein
MSDEKRTTTIELTPQDEECVQAIKKATGEPSTIAAIRFALRAGVREVARYQELGKRILNGNGE